MHKPHENLFRGDPFGEIEDPTCAVGDAAPSVSLDIEKYQAMLNNPDFSEDQKREFLEALWQVIVTLVDAGFKVEAAR